MSCVLSHSLSQVFLKTKIDQQQASECEKVQLSVSQQSSSNNVGSSQLLNFIGWSDSIKSLEGTQVPVPARISYVVQQREFLKRNCVSESSKKIEF